MLLWATSRLKKNKSSKVFPAQLTETNQYYHSPSLAVFPLLSSFKLVKIIIRFKLLPVSTENHWLLMKWAIWWDRGDFELQVLLYHQKETRQMFSGFRRLEVYDINGENTPPPQCFFFGGGSGKQLQNTKIFFYIYSTCPDFFFYFFCNVFFSISWSIK